MLVWINAWLTGCDGEAVYAVTALGGVAAYSLDGKLLWQHWLRVNEEKPKRRWVGNAACEVGNISYQ